jgi:hypothetical protein
MVHAQPAFTFRIATSRCGREQFVDIILLAWPAIVIWVNIRVRAVNAVFRHAQSGSLVVISHNVAYGNLAISV